MKVRSRTLKWLKVAVIGFFLISLAAFLMISKRPVAFASASGPSPSFTNAPAEGNCAACHIGSPLNSGGGSIQILGLPATYLPGQQIPVTVTAAQDDAVIYGFQLTAIDGVGKTVGTFTLPNENPPRSQVINNIVQENPRLYVEHTVDGLVDTEFGSNTWTFLWTAPPESAGEIVFYAAGNAANGDGSPSGDFIYTTSAAIGPGPATISISGRVLTSSGMGLRNAVVRLVNQDTFMTIPTNSLGYYSFTDVAAGQTYQMTVASKRYRFESRSISPDADLTDVDFNGLE
ncbi:hypothetical protein BH20ACI2_BH20ACI2_12120 [soil metagenome]